MNDRAAIKVWGEPATTAVVLDSPHSGCHFPADFNAAVSEFDLRDGEDCFVDELYQPATELGIPLLAAQFPRTYIDANRHAGDIDLALMQDQHWPEPIVASGKAEIGKALIWRTLDDGRPIYKRLLSVEEARHRIAHYHAPYHQALGQLINSTWQQHGKVVHLNCHSMPAVAGVMGEGGAGKRRVDFVLGDRDGTSCSPALTQHIAQTLCALGYQVAINDPYKGVELVRAFSDPASGKHSLQVEINKALYMDEAKREKHAGFAKLQQDLMTMLRSVLSFTD